MCAAQRERIDATLLHVVADWPGYFPMCPTAVRMLVDAGADPDQVGTTGEPSETALHDDKFGTFGPPVYVAAQLIATGIQSTSTPSVFHVAGLGGK